MIVVFFSCISVDFDVCCRGGGDFVTMLNLLAIQGDLLLRHFM